MIYVKGYKDNTLRIHINTAIWTDQQYYIFYKPTELTVVPHLYFYLYENKDKKPFLFLIVKGILFSDYTWFNYNFDFDTLKLPNEIYIVCYKCLYLQIKALSWSQVNICYLWVYIFNI